MKRSAHTTYHGVTSFLLLSMTTLVSAGPVEGVEQLLTGLGEVILLIIRFISDTILSINSFDEFLFAKLIVSIIIFLVTYSTITKSEIISKDKSINRIIAASVTILAIRFMPDNEFVNAILLPYGVFGAAITTFLPLAIYFFFVEDRLKGTGLRRSAWIFYGAFFVGLWWMRRNDISEEIAWIYAIALGIILILIVFDKYVNKVWKIREIKNILTSSYASEFAHLENKLHQLTQKPNPSEITKREIEKIRERMEKIGSKI
jgi:hypothetical protein